MTTNGNHPERLDKKVRSRRLRCERAATEHQRSIAQNFALIGALGWTIVIPPLLGVLAGRWLDQYLPGPSRLFWSLGLMVAGLVLGCTLAWKRIRRE